MRWQIPLSVDRKIHRVDTVSAPALRCLGYPIPDTMPGVAGRRTGMGSGQRKRLLQERSVKGCDRSLLREMVLYREKEHFV